MAKKIAVATYDGCPGLYDRDDVTGDLLIAPALAALGAECHPIPWSSKNVDWDDFDAILIRSTYDYQDRSEEFKAWLQNRMVKGAEKVWNPPSAILWNMNKNYLKYFERNGVYIGKTKFIEKGTHVGLQALVKSEGWNKAVIKPVIGGCASKLFLYESERNAQEKQALFDEYLQTDDMIIQEYIEEIETMGEYSLIYFDKVFSHAIRKVPVKGDIRCQIEFGGSVESITPSAGVLAASDKILSLIEYDLLYARVDVIEREDGTVCFVESELIEPALYLTFKEGSAERLCERLLDRI